MKIKEEFEKWARKKGMSLDSMVVDKHEKLYIDQDTKYSFEIWMESARRMDENYLKIIESTIAINLPTETEKKQPCPICSKPLISPLEYIPALNKMRVKLVKHGELVLKEHLWSERTK